MRYALALIKLSKARGHADAISKKIDMALTPSCPDVDGWEQHVDDSILEAHEASLKLADLLGDVVVDIEANEKAQKLLATEEGAA